MDHLLLFWLNIKVFVLNKKYLSKIDNKKLRYRKKFIMKFNLFKFNYLNYDFIN